MQTILIVDDDAKLLEMLRRTLAYDGYRVVTAADGRQALARAASERPDAIVLDWMLPEIDGPEVARRLREAGDGMPILMLTARDAVEDRVRGLDSGSDDYLPKPFAPEELQARLRALLRRVDPAEAERSLAFEDLRLDPASHETWRGARRFSLTPTEYALLEHFLRHPRRVQTREQLLEAVWGYDFGGEANVVEVYIGYLRRKTEAGGEPRLIHTVRGTGYVLRAEP